MVPLPGLLAPVTHTSIVIPNRIKESAMSRLDPFWDGPIWGAIADAVWRIVVKQGDKERGREAAKQAKG